MTPPMTLMTPMTSMTPARLLGALALLSAAWRGSAAPPVISAPWGRISGKDSTSPGGRAYAAYLAIPYAQPPVGARRWARPEAHPGPGAGAVHDGAAVGLECPQVLFFAPPGAAQRLGEDCLTLNVFVPEGAQGGKSVMVFIHGGGFQFGSARGFTPSELVTENDVIVVVIQYRLGILGFLSSGDGAVSGNYGLWDQTLALEWVKANIRAFGGDADSITLFGQSAGSSSVGFQMLSPHSQGLFTKAIFQSGMPTNADLLEKTPSRAFSQLAGAAGCLSAGGLADRAFSALTGAGRGPAENLAALDCLRRVDFSTLMTLLDPISPTPWVPTVDADFVPRDPSALLLDADYLRRVGATELDVLMGVTNNEGAFNANLEVRGFGATTTTTEVDPQRSRNRTSAELSYRSQALADDDKRRGIFVDVADFFYNQPLLANGKANIQGLADTISDIRFVVPTIEVLQAVTKAATTTAAAPGGGAPRAGRQYLYLFNHYPAERAAGPMIGMHHVDDLAYEFDATATDTRDAFTADDFTIGSTFRAFLSNFAKSGDPQVLDSQTGVPWPQYSLEEQQYLSLELTPRVADHLFAKRVALWTDLFPALFNSTEPAPPKRSPYVFTNPNFQHPPGNGRTFNFKGTLSFYKLH